MILQLITHNVNIRQPTLQPVHDLLKLLEGDALFTVLQSKKG